MSESDIPFKEGGEWYFILYRLGLAIIVVAIVLVMTSKYEGRDIDVTPLESELLLDRVYYSATCFAANDNIRGYAGELDMDKFTQEQLTTCLHGPFYIKVELLNQKQILYNDEDLYIRNEPYCKFSTFTCTTRLVPVLIRNGKITTDTLNITVIIPKQDRDQTIDTSITPIEPSIPSDKTTRAG